MKKTDPFDAPLTKGAAFWVNETNADTFIKEMRAEPQPKEVSRANVRSPIGELTTFAAYDLP